MTTAEKIMEKLTSRKLWLAIAGFVAMLIVFFTGAEEVATQVAALIMAGATVIAYIIGEGLIDAADEGDIIIETEEDKDEDE